MEGAQRGPRVRLLGDKHSQLPELLQGVRCSVTEALWPSHCLRLNKFPTPDFDVGCEDSQWIGVPVVLGVPSGSLASSCLLGLLRDRPLLSLTAAGSARSQVSPAGLSAAPLLPPSSVTAALPGLVPTASLLAHLVFIPFEAQLGPHSLGAYF